MAYTHTNSKGNSYYLNFKNATLRNGKVQPIYYFSKSNTDACDLPEGYEVNENPRNGFLTLKKKSNEKTIIKELKRGS